MQSTATATITASTAKKNIPGMHILDHDIEAVETLLSNILDTEKTSIRDVSGHLIHSGGKRIRPLLVLLTAGHCGNLNDKAYLLAAISELVHNASLLHDDVLDFGEMRRGQVAANQLWGNSRSIITGDYLFAKALELSEQYSQTGILKRLIATIITMCQSEMIQLDNSSNFQITPQDYYRVIEGKTAALMSWCCEAAALLSDGNKNASCFAEFGKHFGYAFQIIDDLGDYLSNKEAWGKDLQADLQDGKLTLPLLEAISQDDLLLAKIKNLSSNNNSSEKLINEIITSVTNNSVIEKVKSKAQEHVEQAFYAIEAQKQSVYLQALKDLAVYVVERVG